MVTKDSGAAGGLPEKTGGGPAGGRFSDFDSQAGGKGYFRKSEQIGCVLLHDRTFYEKADDWGTQSGCGKTTVTAAVLAALTARKMKLAPYKCGPDYIDPMFHRRITGTPSINLTVFFRAGKTSKDFCMAYERKRYGCHRRRHGIL